MRRVLAITLLLAFGSPLVLPLFASAADPDTRLPACCRRHGNHHCAGTMGSLASNTGPAFTSPPCPLYPTAATLSRLTAASLSTLPSLSAAASISNAPEPAAPRPSWTFRATANLKRGPPAFLA